MCAIECGKQLGHDPAAFSKVFITLGLKAATNMKIQETVPWSDRVTGYDKEHFTLYMKLLVASSDGANELEMARAILGVDPAASPEFAKKIVGSHLARANWLLVEGYKELFAA
ncbi:hypothetical protein LA5095_02291 [Roseibium album]|uniref:DUF2285 domain-containing protein n=2 Tax=Roseibium album TaxID=311410 RepID=A0A0M6ZUV4_9HYPH|nr:hypothetical protein LA5094_01236 [Roseibium album]CTQ66569.1 hypothetical protein LA5096_01148 [Roseibium album]CTQ71674.1 hypothetical protein LA5095_02291 [Roseibium album]